MPGYHYWDHVPPLAKDTALVPHEITVNTQTPSLAYNPSSISPLPNLPLGSSFHTGFLVVPTTLEVCFCLYTGWFLSNCTFFSPFVSRVRRHLLREALPYQVIWSDCTVTLYHLILFYVWYLLIHMVTCGLASLTGMQVLRELEPYLSWSHLYPSLVPGIAWASMNTCYNEWRLQVVAVEPQ